MTNPNPTRERRIQAQIQRQQGQPIIQIRDLNNSFGSHVVHEHLDMDLYAGEIVGVVGGSGTGKSVLLRSILGLRPPTSGQITVFGQNINELDSDDRSLVERRFGVLFQQGALFSSLTVLENVAVPFIEIDRDVLEVDVESLAQTQVLETYFAGQLVYQAQLPPSLNP